MTEFRQAHAHADGNERRKFMIPILYDEKKGKNKDEKKAKNKDEKKGKDEDEKEGKDEDEKKGKDEDKKKRKDKKEKKGKDVDEKKRLPDEIIRFTEMKLYLENHTYVMTAGSFTVRPRVSSVIPAESGIPSACAGSVRPYRVVNRILFSSGGLGLTTPTRLRFLFRPTPLVPFQRNGMYD